MHSDGSALTSRDANHGAEAEGGANTGPTAERIESIDVGEKATGTAAPEQLATADRKMFPGFVRTRGCRGWGFCAFVCDSALMFQYV